MDISRDLVIKILKYLDKNKGFYFPFRIMCKEYSRGYKGDDFEEITLDERAIIESNSNYKTFQLWENLQNLYEDTTPLLAKGFIEKITRDSIEKEIEREAKGYRELWKERLCESENIEEYSLNEFWCGKAEGFEEALNIVKKYCN